MVRSPDVDTYFFDITTGVIHGDKLASFICIICRKYYILKINQWIAIYIPASLLQKKEQYIP